jgi:hypothetical protein
MRFRSFISNLWEPDQPPLHQHFHQRNDPDFTLTTVQFVRRAGVLDQLIDTGLAVAARPDLGVYFIQLDRLRRRNLKDTRKQLPNPIIPARNSQLCSRGLIALFQLPTDIRAAHRAKSQQLAARQSTFIASQKRHIVREYLA